MWVAVRDQEAGSNVARDKFMQAARIQVSIGERLKIGFKNGVKSFELAE